MNPNIIGGLVKRTYPNFDMFSFDNRLRLQKFTYFLQHVFELNIGYDFNWYTYGPYCMELTKDGFQADFDKIKPLGFSSEGTEKRFLEFLKFFEEKKEDNEWLEIASSIHLLKRIYPSKSDSEIVEQVKNKHEYFNNKERKIIEILIELKKKNFIK